MGGCVCSGTFRSSCGYSWRKIFLQNLKIIGLMVKVRLGTEHSNLCDFMITFLTKTSPILKMKYPLTFICTNNHSWPCSLESYFCAFSFEVWIFRHSLLRPASTKLKIRFRGRLSFFSFSFFINTRVNGFELPESVYPCKVWWF